MEMFKGGMLAGMPEADRNNMLAYTLMNLGGGILSGNQPGASFGQALGQGMLSGSQAMMQYPQIQMRQQAMQQRVMDAENKRKYAEAVQKVIASGGKMDNPELLANLAGFDPGAAFDVMGRREDRAFRSQEREEDRKFRQSILNQEIGARRSLAAAEREAKLAEAQGKAPSLVELFDEQTGQPYKARWNPETQSFERIGGVKAPGQGITYTDAQGNRIQIGGGSPNAPKGYRYNAQGGLEPIPGGPVASAEAGRREGETKTANIVLDTIDRAAAIVDRAPTWTTGMGGAALSDVPGTGARDLKALLDTVKANIGFQALNEMRAQSPTGGALGQVTERELAFLQATVANLEQSQSTEQFKQNLARVRQAFDQVINRGLGNEPPATQGGNGPPAGQGWSIQRVE